MKGPAIVAEIGASHCGSLTRALDLVDAASAAGADAVKLQTWDVMTVSDEVIPDGPWAGRRLADLYADARTPWDWHGPIFARCRELGVIGFSTPFDAASVAFLEMHDAPLYKVASFEITDLELIRCAARTGKHVILSTGMATEDEILAAVLAARAAGAAQVTLLKCVSAYPAPLDGFNLRTMADMARAFGVSVGLSDHTRGSTAAVAATALGATVIEKHITVDGAGPDGGFASTVDEFAAMVREVRAAAAVLGQVSYGPSLAEASSLRFRRSLWATRDIAAGEAFTRENVAALRPVGGLPPDAIERVRRHRSARAVSRGTAITEDLIR